MKIIITLTVLICGIAYLFTSGFLEQALTAYFSSETKTEAKKGDAEAQFELGLQYYHGQGVDKDVQQAIHWWTLAAEQGHANARYHLGVINGSDGALTDPEQAFHWYMLAAKQGHAGAQNNLATAYDDGEGTPKDEKKALYWYQQSAANGGKVALCNLGRRYFYGQGVTQDRKKAKQLIKASFEGGCEDAKTFWDKEELWKY